MFHLRDLKVEVVQPEDLPIKKVCFQTKKYSDDVEVNVNYETGFVEILMTDETYFDKEEIGEFIKILTNIHKNL